MAAVDSVAADASVVEVKAAAPPAASGAGADAPVVEVKAAAPPAASGAGADAPVVEVKAAPPAASGAGAEPVTRTGGVKRALGGGEMYPILPTVNQDERLCVDPKLPEYVKNMDPDSHRLLLLAL